MDSDDAFPFDPNESKNMDGDGVGNNTDTVDDNDGIPDLYESANDMDSLIADAHLDPDGDGSTNIEYSVGTDPQDDASKPEGDNGVNYILFRDHFDDYQYEDRWYLKEVHPDAIYSLYESGTELENILLKPVNNCVGTRLESFATVDAGNAVLKARLNLGGYGNTSIGLMQNLDLDNRIEVQFDSDASPYLHLVSVDGGALTEAAATTPTSYYGSSVELRLVKTGADYYLLVNGVLQAQVNNMTFGSIWVMMVLLMDDVVTHRRKGIIPIS